MILEGVVPVALALAGALILVVSLRGGLGVSGDVPGFMRPRWLAAVWLIGFFVAGYAVFIYVLLWNVPLSIELLAGGVFFGGACFVYIMTRLTGTTIRRIHEKDRDLETYARDLTTRTVELEREISERMRAEEQAGSRLKNLSALHAIDLIISSSLDMEVTLTAFLEQAVRRLNVHAACVLRLDRHTQILKFEAGVGFRTPYIKGTTRRLGTGHAGMAALEDRIVKIADLGAGEEPFDRAALVEDEDFVAYYAVPLVAKGQVNGVLEIFHRAPLTPPPEWLDFLKALALQAAIAIDNATMFKDLQRTNAEIILAYDTTLEGWSRALELRDEETEGHTQRVVDLTVKMATAMGMKEEDLVHVRRGALLHDIGKMSIPDTILKKSGSLSEEEWEIMRSHPANAFELLSPIAYLRPALDIPYCHHEKWDGTGYPRRLRGEQIPLAARIFSVVDTWDAVRSPRRYHQAWSREQACEHIRSLAGTHFDPRVVDVFHRVMCSREGDVA